MLLPASSRWKHGTDQSRANPAKAFTRLFLFAATRFVPSALGLILRPPSVSRSASAPSLPTLNTAKNNQSRGGRKPTTGEKNNDSQLVITGKQPVLINGIEHSQSYLKFLKDSHKNEQTDQTQSAELQGLCSLLMGDLGDRALGERLAEMNRAGAKGQFMLNSLLGSTERQILSTTFGAVFLFLPLKLVSSVAACRDGFDSMPHGQQFGQQSQTFYGGACFGSSRGQESPYMNAAVSPFPMGVSQHTQFYYGADNVNQSMMNRPHTTNTISPEECLPRIDSQIVAKLAELSKCHLGLQKFMTNTGRGTLDSLFVSVADDPVRWQNAAAQHEHFARVWRRKHIPWAKSVSCGLSVTGRSGGGMGSNSGVVGLFESVAEMHEDLAASMQLLALAAPSGVPDGSSVEGRWRQFLRQNSRDNHCSVEGTVQQLIHEQKLRY